MKSMEGFIRSYKGIHSVTLLSVLRWYIQEEHNNKWKRGKEQMAETKAIESILILRKIKFEKIIGKRKV